MTFSPARSIMRIRGVLLTPMPMTAMDFPRRVSKYSWIVSIAESSLQQYDRSIEVRPYTDVWKTILLYYHIVLQNSIKTL